MAPDCQDTYDSLVVIFAVSAVFDIVHVIARLLAEEPGALSARDVEALLASGSVALHARAGRSAVLAAVGLAKVADLKRNTRKICKERGYPGTLYEYSCKWLAQNER